MKNGLEYIVFILFSRFFSLIGLKLSRKFSSFIAFVFYYFIPIRKKVVIKNLQIAFPQKNSSEIKSLAYKTYKSFAVTLVEIMYLPYMNKQQLIDAVDCANPELIIDKYNQRKGVILLSSHFCNLEFIAISVAMQIGIP
ncbi:MAG: hypothetical protein P8X47_10440 [Ignavibacteriaceae bacterium]